MSEQAVVIRLRDDDGYQELLSGRPRTRGMRSGRVFLKEGQCCGRHSTGGHEEMLVFLGGKGKAYTGQDKQNQYDVGQGQVVYIPPYTVHDIENPHPEPLVYIYCVAPADEDAG